MTICEDTDEETVVREGMEETEKKLEEDDLEEALMIMVALGEADLSCDDVEVLFFRFFEFHWVSNSKLFFLQSLAGLVEQYINASLSAVDGNSTNLPSTTTLMELLGVIGEKNCAITDDLFNSLYEVQLSF